ncbi:MAG: methionine synthase, partial [Clostridia bacterium]|nr:methionine synthase [Clostridia bacterium]
MDLTLTDFPLSEALRYMGCPGGKANPDTLALAESCARKLLAAACPKWLYQVYTLLPGERGVELDCGLSLPGSDLAVHLKGCDRAALLCVTLSAPADALIRRAQAVDMAEALALDACATAAVEAACDLAEAEIKRQFPGCEFPFRFSPGYGDLPITLQDPILTLLDAPRKIGLCATDSSILTPRKSVTAVLGIGHGLARGG